MTGPRQPLAALSDYELRFLVAHLAEAARPTELYRVLTLDTPDGRNAWFDAKEAARDLSGYVADVETATRAVQEAQRRAGRPADLAVEYRYTLMLGSVSALAGQVTPPLLQALVRHGIWTLDDALVTVARTRDSRQRAEGLVTLTAVTPALRRPELVDNVRAAIAAAAADGSVTIDDAWKVVQLTDMARLVGGDVRDQLVGDAVDLVVRLLQRHEHSRFTDSVTSLVPLLSPARIQTLVDAAVAVLDSVGYHDMAGGLTLRALAGHVSGPAARTVARCASLLAADWLRADIAVRVAPHLPPAERARTLRDGRAAAERWNTASALLTVLPTAGSAARRGLVRRAVALAEAIRDPAERLELLLVLLPLTGATGTRLHDAATSAARELAQDGRFNPFRAAGLLTAAAKAPESLHATVVDAVLDAGRRLRNIDQVHVLTAVAQQVAEPRRTELLAEAVATTAASPPDDHSFALRHLAPVLPRQLTVEVLRATRMIRDGDAITEAVAGLAPFRSYPPGTDMVDAARATAGDIDFPPMKVLALAAFARRLAGQERAAVLAHALHYVVHGPSGATEVVDCLTVLAPLIAESDHDAVVRAWDEAVTVAGAVANPRWREPVFVGLLVARPRRAAEPSYRRAIEGLQDSATGWRAPSVAERFAIATAHVPLAARGRLLADLAAVEGATDTSAAAFATVARHLGLTLSRRAPRGRRVGAGERGRRLGVHRGRRRRAGRHARRRLLEELAAARPAARRARRRRPPWGRRPAARQPNPYSTASGCASISSTLHPVSRGSAAPPRPTS